MEEHEDVIDLCSSRLVKEGEAVDDRLDYLLHVKQQTHVSTKVAAAKHRGVLIGSLCNGQSDIQRIGRAPTYVGRE